MRIYLDTCCLNRPLDRSTDVRVRREAEAVLGILAKVDSGEWTLLGGDALSAEIAMTPDPYVRTRVTLIAAFAAERVAITPSLSDRAEALCALGIKSMDALHLASAEAGAADVFLTTDDRLLRAAGRVGADLAVAVRNPVDWLEEMP